MIFYISALIIIIGFFLYRFLQRNKFYIREMFIEKMRSDLDYKRTLAMGLYYRFKTKEIDEKNTNLFIREDPFAFEDFVGNVLSKKLNGNAFVTKRSGDFGVDIQIDINEDINNRVYIQVKCYKDDLNYEPIALVNSKMSKDKVKKGMVITTSNFSDEAREYAEGLNIDLINGVQFVEMWMEAVAGETKQIKELQFEF
ncbi:restriction endonuclease [Gottfriedia acidiceleris]|uniref:restriction endonuclease n=1 Tax=Gottfriedia acidiceleris TaxID=371036 RepID=UPI002F265FC9